MTGDGTRQIHHKQASLAERADGTKATLRSLDGGWLINSCPTANLIHGKVSHEEKTVEATPS